MAKSKISATQVAVGAGIVGVGAAAWYFLKKKDEGELPSFAPPDLTLPDSGYADSPWADNPMYDDSGFYLGDHRAKVTPTPTTPTPQARQYEPPVAKTAQPDTELDAGTPQPRTVEQSTADAEAEAQLIAQQQAAELKRQQQLALIAATKKRLEDAKNKLMSKGWVLSPIQNASQMAPVSNDTYGSYAKEIFTAFGVDPESKQPVITVELGAHKATGILVAALSDNTGMTQFSVILAKPKVIVPEYAPTRGAAQGQMTSSSTQSSTTTRAQGAMMPTQTEIPVYEGKNENMPSVENAIIMNTPADAQRAQGAMMEDTTTPSRARGATSYTSATQTSATAKAKTPQEVLQEILAEFRSIGLCRDPSPPWARIGRISTQEVAAEWFKAKTLFDKYGLGAAWQMDVGGVDRDKAHVRYVFTLKAQPKYKVVLKRC